MRRQNKILADEIVVFGVWANPEPLHSVWDGNSEGSIMQAYANAAIFPTFDGFEVK